MGQIAEQESQPTAGPGAPIPMFDHQLAALGFEASEETPTSSTLMRLADSESAGSKSADKNQLGKSLSTDLYDVKPTAKGTTTFQTGIKVLPSEQKQKQEGTWRYAVTPPQTRQPTPELSVKLGQALAQPATATPPVSGNSDLRLAEIKEVQESVRGVADVRFRQVQDFRADGLESLAKHSSSFGRNEMIKSRSTAKWTDLPESIHDGDRFDAIIENEFLSVSANPLSTFSVDVDTASYSKVRRVLSEGRLPSPDAVRVEELVNYFDYQYKGPGDDDPHPFATDVTITACPWNKSHRLARVAIQGKRILPASRPRCNLVFLLDVSGSMNRPNKLPLVIDGMKMLTSQLHKDDRVAIVVYAGAAGLVLESTPARKQKVIMQALSELTAGGSTAGGEGIQLAYSTARDHFIDGGVNRVVLCTDGDFNVGVSDTGQLVELIKKEASDGIFLTALGFGMGDHNDAMLEQISGNGNGNYAFIDTVNEANKVLVRETDATLVTIAKNVKLQIEFNPRLYSSYRLIGYENRVMATEDFEDDRKDAGEIGAGHQVTALYELIPAKDSVEDAKSDLNNDPGEDSAGAVKSDAVKADADPLRYQRSPSLKPAASGNEAMFVKLRYMQPDGKIGIPIDLSAIDGESSFDETDSDFRFAAAVAAFGMQLRGSPHAGDWTLKDVKRVAQNSLGEDEYDLRSEFVKMVQSARNLKGE